MRLPTLYLGQKSRPKETVFSGISTSHVKFRWSTEKLLKMLLCRAKLESIIEISLAGCPINRQAMKLISKNCGEKLLSLNLAGCSGITPRAMKYISKLSKLQYLSMRSCDGMAEDTLKYLSSMDSLKYLDMKEIERNKRSEQDKRASYTMKAPTPTATIRTTYGPRLRSPCSVEVRGKSHAACLLDEQLGHGHDTSKYYGRSSLLQSDPECDPDSGDDWADTNLRDLHRGNRGRPLERYTPASVVLRHISNLKNLTYLNISEWNSLTIGYEVLQNLKHLKALHLQNSAALRFVADLTNLEHLSFSSHMYANYYCDAVAFANLVDRVPAPLNNAHIDATRAPSQVMFEPLQALPKLVSLDFTNCFRITDAGLGVVASVLPNIQHLKLCACDSITDVTLKEVIPIWASSLKQLDLRGLDKITDSGVLYLKKMTSLQYLNLKKCRSLTSNICAAIAHIPSLVGLDLSFLNIENIAKLGLSSIRHLSLRSCPFLKIKGLISYLQATRYLRSLDTRECSTINHSLSWAKHWHALQKALLASLIHLWSDAVEIGIRTGRSNLQFEMLDPSGQITGPLT